MRVPGHPTYPWGAAEAIYTHPDPILTVLQIWTSQGLATGGPLQQGALLKWPCSHCLTFMSRVVAAIVIKFLGLQI